MVSDSNGMVAEEMACAVFCRISIFCFIFASRLEPVAWERDRVLLSASRRGLTREGELQKNRAKKSPLRWPPDLLRSVRRSFTSRGAVAVAQVEQVGSIEGDHLSARIPGAVGAAVPRQVEVRPSKERPSPLPSRSLSLPARRRSS